MVIIHQDLNMKDNKKYLEEVRAFIKQYQQAQDQIFEEMCKTLNVSKDDEHIFFDYCYNDYEFERGMEVINSYLKKGDKIGWDKEECDVVMEAYQKTRPVGKFL